MQPRQIPVKKFRFTNLESIHLTLCPDANDKFIKRLVKDCMKLCNVELFGCNLITMKGLIPITTLPELRHFGASQVNDKVFDKLSRLKTFRCLSLSLNENTMETKIFNFFRRSQNLKMSNVRVGTSNYLFDDYAREFGIKLNRDQKHYFNCMCRINWKKQFYN
ncbi:hypothetical protein PV327_005037 [Microctonus hyperodae]|uniref:Uncharacterized protein n=1 Tax=Microctonus hyperodae TaxID=165561 RepID=A0AA39G0K3_MICHY|nr:hypothetical protein PV327_005037 [Microctonus hyperodae]